MYTQVIISIFFLGTSIQIMNGTCGVSHIKMIEVDEDLNTYMEINITDTINVETLI